MGCHSSKAASAPIPTATAADQLAKGTPAPCNGEGSETSTDDASGEASADTLESNDAEEPMLPAEIALDLQTQLRAFGPVGGEGEEVFLEVAEMMGDIDCDSEYEQDAKESSDSTSGDAGNRIAPKVSKIQLARQGSTVSCLSGTTPRDPSRRVSFSEAGPEVKEVESTRPEFTGLLRRANAVSAANVELDFDTSDDPAMEALLQLHVARREAAAAAWAGGGSIGSSTFPERSNGLDWAEPLDGPGLYQPVLATNHRPRSLTFGWCCVTRDDGSLPTELQGDLEYEASSEDIFMPYASQLEVLPPMAPMPLGGLSQVDVSPQKSACA